MDSPSVFEGLIARVRLTCADLPEVCEERAWTGVRWVIGGKNFAHIVCIDGGKPKAYAKAAGTSGPVSVLTFRLAKEKCAAARFRRPPFFRPVWFPNIAGVVLGPQPDWEEIDALLRDSYRLLAPKKLAALVE
jgi:hypothetical protein